MISSLLRCNAPKWFNIYHYCYHNGYVISLCRALLSHLASHKGILWQDSQFLNLGSSEKIENFAPECRGILEFKDVSSFFNLDLPEEKDEESLFQSLKRTYDFLLAARIDLNLSGAVFAPSISHHEL